MTNKEVGHVLRGSPLVIFSILNFTWPVPDDDVKVQLIHLDDREDDKDVAKDKVEAGGFSGKAERLLARLAVLLVAQLLHQVRRQTVPQLLSEGGLA